LVGEKEQFDFRWDVRRGRRVAADVFRLDLEPGSLDHRTKLLGDILSVIARSFCIPTEASVAVLRDAVPLGWRV
jgi:hypothetical protein